MNQTVLAKALEIYNKVQSFDLKPVMGLDNRELLPPSKMNEYLDNSKKEWVKNEIMGIGGYEYVPKYQLRNRCLLRLSFATYQRYGVRFSDTDYVESLTQMEEGDAREWIHRC